MMHSNITIKVFQGVSINRAILEYNNFIQLNSCDGFAYFKKGMKPKYHLWMARIELKILKMV